MKDVWSSRRDLNVQNVCVRGGWRGENTHLGEKGADLRCRDGDTQRVVDVRNGDGGQSWCHVGTHTGRAVGVDDFDRFDPIRGVKTGQTKLDIVCPSLSPCTHSKGISQYSENIAAKTLMTISLQPVNQPLSQISVPMRDKDCLPLTTWSHPWQ